jgi:hypothetical protein
VTRLILARALGILLGMFGFAVLWNGIVEIRYASGVAGSAVVVLDILAGPMGLLGGYWLWRRDRRALLTSALALALGILAGTTAAWVYTPGPDRTSATLGAFAGGLVFGVAVILLAWLALKRPKPETLPSPFGETEEL